MKASILSFKDVSIKVLMIEVILFFAVILTAGYFFDRSNPLSIHGSISYLLIFMAVITLYYGIFAGLLGIILSVPALFYFYKPFPLDFFLFNLIMVLIFGEFYFYWSKNKKRLEEKNEYVEEKFNELRKNYFFLKLSYDQMEKSYVTKPVTIRGTVQKIKEIFAKKGASYEELIKTMAQLFNIERASLFVKDVSFNRVAFIGEPITIDMKDYLVMESLRKKAVTYLPSILKEEHSSEYLAVIPIFFMQDEAKAMLLVKDISFTDFNRENLLLMHLFLFYFFESLDAASKISKSLAKYLNIFDIDFLIEMNRLYNIWKKFKIDSAAVIYLIHDEGDNSEFASFMRDNIRNLDMINSIRKGGVSRFIILLPFTAKSGTKSFTDRVNGKITDKFGKTFLEKIKQGTILISKEPEFLLDGIFADE
ncbi:PelD GGDEF domain-containing protein [Candidatus Acidulodesulfobacterium sp. H_13]|uniref:PelD GGDEF domain-containing protein n=1 Tax=Candidatus Acidulodesulfobacterium sp. H_13 TaxID=3395470 RepID=UPI003AF951B6